MKLKIGDFVFVDSTRGRSSARGWQGRGYGVITSIEDCDIADVPFAQVLVNGELRWVLIEDISRDPMGDEWYMYVLECSDGTFYTGITTDVKRRLYEHNNTSKGAKYVKARRPAAVIYSTDFENRSAAAKAEYKFKKLTRPQKANIIYGHTDIRAALKLK